MRFNHLYNFISPVTGRILSTTDYVPLGDYKGIATPSPVIIDIRLDIINIRENLNTLEQASFVIGSPNSKIPNAQVLNTLDNGYMFNTDGVVSTVSSIPPSSLALTENHVFVGNSSNQAADVATIQVGNLPNLTDNKVWVGNSSNRPVEMDYPSSGAAPADSTYILQTADADLPNAQALADLSDLPGILWSSTAGIVRIAIPHVDYATPSDVADAITTANAYTDAVAITTLASANAYTDAVAIITLASASAYTDAVAITTLASAAAFTTASIAALRLNDIPASGDIDISGYKIINAGNPVNPQELTTKYYVDNAISGVPGSITITLTGDVTGSGVSTSPISTTVVSVHPSAIIGYPGQNKAFLRGDGTWTNILGGSLGLAGISPTVELTLGGTDSNYAAGPHIECITNLDIYREFQLLAWTHNNIALSFDAYYNGTNYLSSYSGSNFQIIKTSNQLQFNYATGIAQGSTVTWSNSLILNTSGVVTVPSTGQLSVLATTGSSSNTTGCAVFSGGIGVTGQVYTTGGLRLADTNIYFRTGADVNHGLGWYGSTKLFAGASVDGPVLYGFTGGVLGTLSSGTARILAWNSTNVSILPTTSSTSTSTGALTCSGGVGIAGTLNSNIVASGNGSVSAPSYAFTSDLTTGLYRIGASEIGIGCGGTKIIDIATSAVTYSANILTGTGKYIGIETSTPHAPLQFSNTLADRKIVLLETANNDNQVFGFGTALNTLVYQVDSTGSDHVFSAGTSSTTSQVLAKIKGTGGLDNASFKLTSVGNPINPADATNKSYVDSAVAGVPTSITLVGNVTGSGSTGSPITTTLVLTLDQIPLAVANVNINTHKLINVVDPTNPQDASTKNYTDTRTITLTGGVTGSNTLGNSIATTVAICPPSAITGYPANTTTFLRGDGTWTNILSGKLGIGSPASPVYTLDVAGIAKFSGSTLNNQLVALSQGYNQGGFGGGNVGTNKTMSANTTLVFDTATVNSNSKGFYGAVFDGRYIYFVPNSNGAAFGQITRYDTTQPFASGSSYSVFDTTTVNSSSKGFIGAVFDGQYIYFVPNSNGAAFGQITRYDTAASFTSGSSYSVFDSTTVNSNSKGFSGAVFDGRYIYFVPNSNGAIFGQVTRYDTTQPFTSGSSYSVFDTTTVNASSKGFFGAIFDGRYIYFVPNSNGAIFGQITRYDTTQPFTSGSSYNVFDTTTVNSNSKGFIGAVFDGKYIYFIPYYNGSDYSGQITRYDITQPFASGSSYSVFDTTAVNAASKGFAGAVFDGRYVHLAQNLAGQITQYDITQSFTSSSSYSVFDSTTVNSNSKGFIGAVFDGQYIYFVPNSNGGIQSGQITRIDAYPGSLSASIASSQAPNGLSVGSYAGVNVPPNAGIISSGNVGIGTNAPPVVLSINGTDSNYAAGPHIQCQTSLDVYPQFQLLSWTHNNIALSFDAYYNGTNWLSSYSGSNFQIIKTSNQLQFNYATGIAQGGSITWGTAMILSSSGLSLNSNKITSLAPPTVSTDGANKGYVDTAVAGVPISITLIGNVTGSGSTGSPIATTLVLTLDQIPLAAANVNINTHKLINIVDPTNPQDASTKNYTDTRTITLTGGVTGSGALGTSISTTVAICPPSAITGYPANTTTFLRGDGAWTNILGGSLGIGGSAPPVRLGISGTDSNYAAGPHIQCITSLDAYPEFQLLAWTHDNIALSFDAYYNGTNWLSSYSSSNFQIIKTSDVLEFNYAKAYAQGATISWLTAMLINTSGQVGIGTTPSYTLDVNGTTRVTKLIGNANTPTVSLGSAVGTGATSSISGTALGGVFTVTTGSLGLGLGTIATFTVSAFPASTYAVMFLAASSNAAGITIWASSLTTTTFSLTTTALMSGSSTYKWNYMILT